MFGQVSRAGRMGVLGFALLAAGTGLCWGQVALPSRALTPGAVNPAVTQATIGLTICVPGWTRTVRPPARYTSALKRRQLAALGGDRRMADFEEDHLIPLALGGAPYNTANLWPEPRTAGDGWTAARKDALEATLNEMVCTGRIDLLTAQRAIATNWVAAYRRFQMARGVR